jgi:hypothetical protein
MEYEKCQVNFKVLINDIQWYLKVCNFYEISAFVEFKISCGNFFLALGLMAVTSETLELTREKFGIEMDHLPT